MELTGRILEVRETENLKNNVQKRTFILYIKNTRNEAYSDFFEMALLGANVEKIKPFKRGDEVVVTFELRGRRWENKETQKVSYFPSLQAYDIKPTGATTIPCQPSTNGDLPF